MVYLFLSCEGWQRFGPFAWLRFRDDRQVIEDDTGAVVASFDGDYWRTPGPQSGMQWRDPMVTTQEKHPHPNQGRF